MTRKKKALLSSILTIAVCLCLIAGSTFALFTKKIELNIAVQAGNIDMTASVTDLQLWSVEAADENTADEDKVFDEDGNFYKYVEKTGNNPTFTNGGTAVFAGGVLTMNKITPGDKVTFDIVGENASDIAIRYRYLIECLDGKALMSGLRVTVKDNTYTSLASYSSAWAMLEEGDTIEALETVSISIELPVDAGNEFQGKSTEIRVAVEAVQGNAVVDTSTAPVIEYLDMPTTPDALTTALAAGGEIVLGADVALGTNQITIDKDTTIDLLGYHLDASATVKHAFNLVDGANLTIIGSDEATFTVGAYGLVKITNGDCDVTLIGGNYEGATDNGSFIKPKGNGAINITMTDVSYTDTTDRNFLIDAASYEGMALNITVDGGEYHVVHGITAHGAVINMTDSELYTRGVAIEAGAGSTALIENTKIVVAGGANSAAAPNTCVAASGADATLANGTAVLNNCTLISDAHVFAIYSGVNSAIEANGCVITCTGAEPYQAYTNSVYGDGNINNIVIQ